MPFARLIACFRDSSSRPVRSLIWAALPSIPPAPWGGCFSRWPRHLLRWSGISQANGPEAALRHKRANKEVYCHVTPLGFDRAGDKLVENGQEMATVRRIRQMREKGISLRQIAATLNAKGVPTKRGGRWHLVMVQNVLRIHGRA